MIFAQQYIRKTTISGLFTRSATTYSTLYILQMLIQFHFVFGWLENGKGKSWDIPVARTNSKVDDLQ